jgi:hypothetical protein
MQLIIVEEFVPPLWNTEKVWATPGPVGWLDISLVMPERPVGGNLQIGRKNEKSTPEDWIWEGCLSVGHVNIGGRQKVVGRVRGYVLVACADSGGSRSKLLQASSPITVSFLRRQLRQQVEGSEVVLITQYGWQIKPRGTCELPYGEKEV